MRPLLLLLFASFLRAAAAAKQPSCSPKECGELNISYPFWLMEPGQPPCGPPSFQLKCNISGAFLSRSMFEAYRVVTISVEANSFHVVDDNLPLDTGCPAPWFNISLGIGLGPFVISRSNRELVFLFKCTKQRRTVPVGFRRTPCVEESFVHLGGEFGSHGAQEGLPPDCQLSVVPTLGNGDDYVAMMKSGFVLEWAGLSTDCPKCVESGGECRYSDNGLD